MFPTSLDLENMEFNLGGAGGVLPDKGVGLHQLHVVLLGHPHVQDTLHTHEEEHFRKASSNKVPVSNRSELFEVPDPTP